MAEPSLQEHGRWRLMVARNLTAVALMVTLSSAIVGCVPAYEARLRSLRERGDLAAAERLLEAAESRSPRDPVIIRERGLLAYEQGKFDEAAQLLERALALDPEDGHAALYLAAATERAEHWGEAAARYRRAEALWEQSAAGRAEPPALAAEITCQRLAADDRRIADLVQSRLAAERRGDPPAGERILFLPLEAGGSDVALSLRLGLPALLAVDWERAPAAEPVPFAETLAFLEALAVPIDAPIDVELRERLAQLTGARYVVNGRLTELNDVVSLAPIFIDRSAEAGPREQRLEYQQSRVGTLLDLEKTLLFRLIAAAGVALHPTQEAMMGEFVTRSALAVLLYGEALRLERTGEKAAAAERLDQAVSLDPGFRPAREAQLALIHCEATAGQPDALLALVEQARRAEAEADRRRVLLSEATREAGRLGGPEGEGENLSLNRPVGAGSVSVTIPLPR